MSIPRIKSALRRLPGREDAGGEGNLQREVTKECKSTKPIGLERERGGVICREAERQWEGGRGERAPRGKAACVDATSLHLIVSCV